VLSITVLKMLTVVVLVLVVVLRVVEFWYGGGIEL